MARITDSRPKPITKVISGKWVEVWGKPELTIAICELGVSLASRGIGLGTREVGGVGEDSRWVGFVPEEAWEEVKVVLQKHKVRIPND